MAEPKPLASLSAGLLARKGAASPAMRRQPLGPQPARMPSASALQPSSLDDCGWNDMGYDVDPSPGEARQALDLRPLLTPATPHHGGHAEHQAASEPSQPRVPEVVRQQEALSKAIRQAGADPVDSAAPARAPSTPDAAPVMAPAPSSAPAPAPVPSAVRRKAAFTLRLDAERHLGLRLASAVTHRSSQHILVDLLDAYLARPDVVAAITAGTASAVPGRPARAPGAQS